MVLTWLRKRVQFKDDCPICKGCGTVDLYPGHPENGGECGVCHDKPYKSVFPSPDVLVDGVPVTQENINEFADNERIRKLV